MDPRFHVIKTLSGHPGYGDQYHRASFPAREVVQSTHRTRKAAEHALTRYRRTFQGCTFRIGEDDD